MTIYIKRETDFLNSQLPIHININKTKDVTLKSNNEISLPVTDKEVEMIISSFMTKKQKFTAYENEKITIKSSPNLLWYFISFFILLVLISISTYSAKIYLLMLLLLFYIIVIKFILNCYKIERSSV